MGASRAIFSLFLLLAPSHYDVISAEEYNWDENGYILFCPCMGKCVNWTINQACIYYYYYQCTLILVRLIFMRALIVYVYIYIYMCVCVLLIVHVLSCTIKRIIMQIYQEQVVFDFEILDNYSSICGGC